MADPILCPDCGHDIDKAGRIDTGVWTCFEIIDVRLPSGRATINSCPCANSPSDIARALLAAQARTFTTLADWHRNKATKARLFPGPGELNRTIMEKAARVHDDAARRINEALEGGDDE